MSITLELDDEQSRKLEERTRALGVEPEHLLKSALDSLLDRDEIVQRAKRYVLEKNRELLRRLAQ